MTALSRKSREEKGDGTLSPFYSLSNLIELVA